MALSSSTSITDHLNDTKKERLVKFLGQLDIILNEKNTSDDDADIANQAETIEQLT